MPNFCVKCGAPLSGGPFCVKCGADARNVAPSAQPQSPPSVAQPASPHPASGTSTSANAKPGMSPLAKLGIAAVAIIFVGGAAGAVGLYYVAHRVSQKIHQTEDRILQSSSGTGGDSSAPEDSPSTGDSAASSRDNSMGNVCRFLSKEDVSRAIGVEIIRAQAQDNSCNYIAKGTQADMMARHATAMAATRGADQQTQQMLQQFAGGMFKTFQSENKDSKPDTGEVPVFDFSVNHVDPSTGEAQMRLNAKGLGRLGDLQDLPGIGDQAFVSSDGMIMLRKRDKLAVIMFLSCPCGTEAVKPLAKEIADAL